MVFFLGLVAVAGVVVVGEMGHFDQIEGTFDCIEVALKMKEISP